MKLNNKFSKFLGLAFLLICLVSFAGYQFLFEDNNFVIYEGHDGIKYVLYFLWLLITAAIGYWGWKKTGVQWVIALWILIYAGGTLLLFIAGLIDLRIYQFPHILKEDVRYFRIFLMSPVPFMICYLLGYLVSVNKTGKPSDK